MDDFDPTAFEEETFAADREEGEEGEDAQDDTETPVKQTPFKHALLLCVDVHNARALFASDESPTIGNHLTWQRLIECLLQFIKSRVISREHDRIGLILFGTKESLNGHNQEHIAEVFPLRNITIDSIRETSALATLSYEEFSRKYGSLRDTRRARSERNRPEEVASLSRLFRFCLRTFRINAPVLRYTRRLVLFTHRADPCANLPRERDIALQLGRDVVDNRISIELIPLVLTQAESDEECSKGFNTELFYAPLLQYSERSKIGNLLDVSSKDLLNIPVATHEESVRALDDLSNALRRRIIQTRMLMKSRLRIAPGLIISIAVFLVITEAKKPNPVLLRAKDNKPLRTETTWFEEESGKLLAQDELRRFFAFEGCRVNFTDEELNDIKAVTSLPKYEAFPKEILSDSSEKVRMTLMGFKPVHLLERYRLSLKMSLHWICPVDAEVIGSSVCFNALCRAMWNNQKMAIICWQFRANSAPRLYAGVATVSEEESTAGIYLIALPYAEEIRDIAVEAQVDQAALDQTLESQPVEQLIDIMSKLSLPDDWSPEDIPNPALAKFWNGIEALALGAEEARPVDDKTRPKAELFESLSSDLKSISYGLDLGRGVKRPAASSQSRKAIPTRGIDVAHLQELAKSDALARLTVVALKGHLASLGLQVTGKKADLVDRLKGYLASSST